MVICLKVGSLNFFLPLPPNLVTLILKPRVSSVPRGVNYKDLAQILRTFLLRKKPMVKELPRLGYEDSTRSSEGRTDHDGGPYLLNFWVDLFLEVHDDPKDG